MISRDVVSELSRQPQFGFNLVLVLKRSDFSMSKGVLVWGRECCIPKGTLGEYIRGCHRGHLPGDPWALSVGLTGWAYYRAGSAGYSRTLGVLAENRETAVK